MNPPTDKPLSFFIFLNFMRDRCLVGQEVTFRVVGEGSEANHYLIEIDGKEGTYDFLLQRVMPPFNGARDELNTHNIHAWVRHQDIEIRNEPDKSQGVLVKYFITGMKVGETDSTPATIASLVLDREAWKGAIYTPSIAEIVYHGTIDGLLFDGDELREEPVRKRAA